MPSEESRKTARILLNQIDATFPWNASVDLIAEALDEVKAERTEECVQIALGAHSRATMRAEKLQFSPDHHHEQIAKAEEAMNIAAEIRSLTKGPSQ